MSNCGPCQTTMSELTGNKVQMEDYYSENIFTWCTNCGNYGIIAAMKRALVAENIAPKDVLLCFDIGCNGNGADKIEGYRFHGLHGRVLPFAAGAVVGNPDLKVLASGGDGATLSEGINHLIQSVRGDFNMTFLLHNNSNYALTTGQASKTTRVGQKMSAMPEGVTDIPLNPSQLVLNLGGTFVARGFSGDVNQLTNLIREGLNHKGFSFIEILQSCPTYNKATPHTWYQERIYDINTDEKFNCQDISQAMSAVVDLDNKIATGVLYKKPQPIL